MSTPLQCLIEKGTEDAPVILLLHGRGSDERDLFPLGRELHPTATVVSVRAPFPGAPWGYGGGWAWYKFMGGTTPDPESFAAGQEALDAFVTDELPEKLGHTPTQLVIGGFSQGGTSSLAHALRNPGTVAGVMVFSGFLADHPSIDVARIGTTPVWWGHGTADSAIGFDLAEAGWKSLTAVDAALATITRPGMGHSIDAEELKSAREWLAGVVTAD
ncbi:MAG: dienelactone hydrolase family protein [Gemmatimonadales bacterium]|nr:dienelactone hydrolase family protein [Gemmatimonadales bacterium]